MAEMETIAAPPAHPARAKLAQKARAKVHKAGPRPTGRLRLQARALKLAIDARRLADKPTLAAADRAWAERLAAYLRAAAWLTE